MRRLFPEPASSISLHEAYDVVRTPPPGRPWVSLCMVSSLDGSTVVDRSSRGLSNPVDQELLLTLRSFADIILVGAATVRAEGYGPPRLAHQRIAVVTRTGEFDYSSPLFTSGQVLLIMPSEAPDVPVPVIRAGTQRVDLAAALAQLDGRVVQAEGGASLNGQLAAADLIDEMNLSVSPQISGGEGSRLTTGAPPLSLRMQLAHVLEDDGFLFTRYVRAR